jgi:hypothetical protein
MIKKKSLKTSKGQSASVYRRTDNTESTDIDRIGEIKQERQTKNKKQKTRKNKQTKRQTNKQTKQRFQQSGLQLEND